MKNFLCFILFSTVWFPLFAEIYRPEFKLLPWPEKCSAKCPPLCGKTLLIAASKMEDFNIAPSERSSARGFYDRNNLYIKVRCEDRDITSEVKSPRTANPGNAADAVQIVLKSEKDHGIWVINITANDIVNCFFHHSAGSIVKPEIPEKTGINAQITCFGTLNKLDDTDTAWEALVTIPYSLFERCGLKFTAEEKWTILIRRYNYGIHLNAREISSFPQMTIFNHFEPARYARIIFAR